VFRKLIGLLMVAFFLFLLVPQAFPAEVVVYGPVRDEIVLGKALELTEEEMAQGFLKLIEIDHTESTKTDNGYEVDVFMKYEGNLQQAWNNIGDVLFIHSMLALDDPTQPTPANQELFSDSVGNTQFRASWLPGNVGFSPLVQLTYTGGDWVPESRTTSSFAGSLEGVRPYVQFRFDSPGNRFTEYGVMMRITLSSLEEGSRAYDYYYGIDPDTFELQLSFEEPTTGEPAASEPSNGAPSPSSNLILEHPEYFALGIGIVAFVLLSLVAWKKKWFKRLTTMIRF
jgi:hypothetical protein